MSTEAMKLQEIMSQAQVFASAWSLVGGRFDGGNAMDEAEVAKNELHQMVAEALAQPQQEPVAWAIFTNAGNARMWSTFQPHLQKLADAEGLTITPLYTSPPARKPLTDDQPKRWAVFCGICRKEWSVPYQHPGKSVCDDCVAAHGIKGDA